MYKKDLYSPAFGRTRRRPQLRRQENTGLAHTTKGAVTILMDSVSAGKPGQKVEPPVLQFSGVPTLSNRRTHA